MFPEWLYHHILQQCRTVEGRKLENYIITRAPKAKETSKLSKTHPVSMFHGFGLSIYLKHS